MDRRLRQSTPNILWSGGRIFLDKFSPTLDTSHPDSEKIRKSIVALSPRGRPTGQKVRVQPVKAQFPHAPASLYAGSLEFQLTQTIRVNASDWLGLVYIESGGWFCLGVVSILW
jgi:hypothetical protein